jgi:hypothetical protein
LPAEAANPADIVAGPYDAEAQAQAEPAVQAVFAAARESARRGVLGEGTRRLLRSALDAAGVDLGAYDRAIVDWLAGYEPATVAVIASWVSRAGSRRAPAEPEQFGMLGARMVADLHRRAAQRGDR